MKKATAALLAVLMLLAALSSCGWMEGESGDAPAETAAAAIPTAQPAPDQGEPALPNALKGTPYTYRAAFAEFPASWSALDPLSGGAERIAELISSPLVSIMPVDTETGEYAWNYEMAESIRDVTAEHREDLVDYGCVTGSGRAAAVSSGYVFEIRLRPDAVWENGERITADDYVGSLELLLDPARKSSRAAELLLSPAAPAGAEDYFRQRDEWERFSIRELGYGSAAEAISAGETLVLDMWGLWGLEGALNEEGGACPQWVPITDTAKYRSIPGPSAEPVSAAMLWEEYAEELEPGAEKAAFCAVRRRSEAQAPDFASSVGCYKVDELTFNYVCAGAVTMNELLAAFTNSWLVYLPYFEEGGEDYCTGLSTTLSFGPYRLSSVKPGESVTLSRNPYWYGWRTAEDGSPCAYTERLVDGEHISMFSTTRVIFTRMEAEKAKRAFFEGGLDEWIPESIDVPQLASDGRLCASPNSDTLRILLEPDGETLKRLDDSHVNKYSIALSEPDFRKALSLSINREAVCANLGGTPCPWLIPDSVRYDLYNDPDSVFRRTEAAMRAACGLYGVSFGEGEQYADLEEAYDSITGYDPELAHELFASAAEALIEKGLYTAGEPVRIQVACTGNMMTVPLTKLIELINGFVNAAAKDTAFGPIELIAADRVIDHEGAVASGRYAMGICICRRMNDDPFGAIRQEFDEEFFRVQCAGSRTLLSQPLVLTVNRKRVSMTRLEWARSLREGLASESADTRLYVLAALEADHLSQYCCIPVSAGLDCVMLSEKVQLLTPDRSPVYERGGFRFMSYNYSDSEWEARLAALAQEEE